VNPRQRRGILLLLLAGFGAVGLLIAVSNYVNRVRTEVGPMTTVLRLRKAVGAFRPVTADDVEQAQLPRRWAPQTALQQASDVLGMVTPVELPEGSLLERGVLQAPPVLQPGQREVAIVLDAGTGVAGKIEPGSVVDIYATFEGKQGVPSRSQIIVSGARVIEVGVPTTHRTDSKLGFTEEGKVVPVTFALSVQDSLVLTYAESYATKVRLGLQPGGDTHAVPAADRSFQLPPDAGPGSQP
jgi:pilus assembly protein CpaB